MTNRALIAVSALKLPSCPSPPSASSRIMVLSQLPDCVSGGAVPANSRYLVKDCDRIAAQPHGRSLRGSGQCRSATGPSHPRPASGPVGQALTVTLTWVGAPARATIGVKLHDPGGLNGSMAGAEIGSLDEAGGPVAVHQRAQTARCPGRARVKALIRPLRHLMLANNNLSGPRYRQALNG